MLTPNYDSLNVQLSRFLGDKVAAATTDGNIWSATQRNNIFNMAIRRWLSYQLNKAVATDTWYPLKDYISYDAQALSTSLKTLSSWTGGVVYIIGLPYNVTDAIVVLKMPQELREYIGNSVNQYLTPAATLQYYSTDGSQFRLFGGTPTSNIRLTHVQQHTDLSSGGANDILVPSEYWNEILLLATAIGKEDEPTQERIAEAQVKYAQAEKLMGF